MPHTRSHPTDPAVGGPSGLSFVAYALGWAARGDGRMAIDNPFDGGSDAARAWQDGWLAGPALVPAPVRYDA